MTTRRFGIVSAAAALLALAGSHAVVRPAHGAAAEAHVRIEHFAFAPATLTVPTGTRVRWTNRDEDTHTVTSATGASASAGLDTGETFAHTFAAPGTYAYFCALHPRMRATITVR